MNLQELQVTLDLLSKEIQQLDVNGNEVTTELLKKVAQLAYTAGVEEGKDRIIEAIPDEHEIDYNVGQLQICGTVDISDVADEVLNSSEYRQSTELCDDDYDVFVNEANDLLDV